MAADSHLTPDIRAVARALADASQSRDDARLDDVELAVARLTSGLDPTRARAADPTYRWGAAEALQTALSRLREQMMPTDTARLALQRPHSRLLTALADNPGATQAELADLTGMRAPNVSTSMKKLHKAGLAEPAPARRGSGTGWMATTWGEVFREHDSNQSPPQRAAQVAPDVPAIPIAPDAPEVMESLVTFFLERNIRPKEPAMSRDGSPG
jgi:hypothetical protein